MTALDVLVADGVLNLTRLALLQRMAPTSGQHRTKNRRIKPSTLAENLYLHYPKLLARAIRCKASRPDVPGLLACLSEDDVRELGQTKKLRIELERLVTLTARDWWCDLPPRPDITRTTNPRGAKPTQTPEEIAGEYQPIPDEYLAEIGPPVLWLIGDLGPNLLPLLEDLPTHLEKLDWSGMTRYKLFDDYGIINKFIAQHLRERPWTDRAGKPLQPDFPLMTGAKNGDRFEWPPRNFEHLRVLSVTLQSAHLFLTLLACAGRIGEIEALPRSCVTTARDGKDYIRGWTLPVCTNSCRTNRRARVCFSPATTASCLRLGGAASSMTL